MLSFTSTLAKGLLRSAHKPLAASIRALVLASLLANASVPSYGVTIFVNEIADGNMGYRFGGTGEAAPDGVGETLTGTGTLFSVVRAAADLWEAAITSVHNLTINIGWANHASSTLAVATTPGVGETPINQADIKFDNTGTNWFFDATPNLNEEFGALMLSSVDLAGDVEGPINTGRTYSALGGGLAAGQFDLFSVALHEIGHALGLTTSRIPSDPFPVDNPGLPNQGGLIDRNNGSLGHLGYSTAALFPSVNSGTRKTLSAIDILATAETGGFGSVNLNPAVSSVPEPATMLLISCGLLLIGTRRWQTKRRS